MIPFCKFHGFGNDYIVIEKHHAGDRSLPELAAAICNRHTGAGSDGIAVIERLSGDDADLFCEIVNPDGSIAGFSGNGTRCAVAYVYYKKLWNQPGLKLKTRSGIKNYRLLESDREGSFRFQAEIGKPRFSSDEVPIDSAENLPTVFDHVLISNGIAFKFSAVNVGNPVACLFMEDFDSGWREVGKQLETHEMFPDRANIVFVKVIDRRNIELRIWERGAGETSASGTCSSGAAVLSAARGFTDRQVSVHSPGGITEVVWREDNEMLLTGNAELAYCGEWPG